MGTRGPVPKREAQRRRSNGKSAEKSAAKSAAARKAAAQAQPVTDELLASAEGWHPVAVAWFEAVKASGQSAFYQRSDWATARLVAEAMSRDLNPQPIVVGKGEDATIEMRQQPVKGASLAAYRSHMAALLVTEGDRRRVELELTAPPPPEQVAGDPVAILDEYRGRRSS